MKTVRILLLIVMAALLCACSGRRETEQAAAGEGGQYWRVADTVQIAGNVSSRTLFYGQDSLVYLSRETGEYQLHILPYGRQQTESRETLQCPGEFADTYLLNVYPDGDGFWTLWQFQASGDAGERHELVRYDMQGKPGESLKLDRAELEEYIPDIKEVVRTGEYYDLLTSGALLTLDGKGELRKTEKAEHAASLLSLGEALYLVQGDLSRTTVRRVSNGALSEVLCELPVAGQLFRAGEDGKILISGENRLLRCDTGDWTAEEVLKWDEAGLKPQEIEAVIKMTGENILVCDRGSGGHCIRILEPSDTADERITLTLLCNQYEDDMQDWVYGFNQVNETYRVSIEDPGFGELGKNEEVQTKVQLMLGSSQAPDLVDLNYIDRWEEYAEKGVFADLTPYLEGSWVREEDYLPSVWACGTVGGRQIFIPSSFGFMMLYGSEEYLGADMGWTLEEALELGRSHKDIPLYPDGSWGTMFLFLEVGMEEFIDFDRKECDFEQELFYDLLRYTAELEAAEFDNEGDYYFSMVEDGRTLTDLALFSEIDDYLLYQSVLLGESADKRIQLALKGFPSKDGRPVGSGSTVGSLRCAICGSSANKEGAWQFIEYVLGEADRERLSGFSARTDRLKEQISQRNTEYLSSNWEYLEPRELTGEDVEGLLSLINQLKFESYRDEVILRIIEEEVQAYYSGQKSEEEVARIVQNRVQLYLEEQ